jgi:hypothetical protein
MRRMEAARTLTPAERELVHLLLASKKDPRTVTNSVLDMRDGGMGSLRFSGSEQRCYGSTLAEAEFKDADGTPVSVALMLDETGDLFELDIWKVDFSPLVRIPPVEQITITR